MTWQEAEKRGLKLKEDTDTTELTLEEVAKKFKINVSKLRIKE
jgi:hypothetical protein